MSPFWHRIATVHQSCQHCFFFKPEIYIIFARAPASMTTYKVTEHWGHPLPNPQLSVNRNGWYIFTSLTTRCQPNWENYFSSFLAFEKKKKRKEKTISTTKRCRWVNYQGILSPLMTLSLWSVKCILDLHICWLLISNCQQISMHMLKYKKTLIGCSPVWLQYDQGEVQWQRKLLWCVSPDQTSQDMANTTNKAQLMMIAALLMQIDNYERNISLAT